MVHKHISANQDANLVKCLLTTSRFKFVKLRSNKLLKDEILDTTSL